MQTETRMSNTRAGESVPFSALSFSFNDRAHGRMTVRMRYLDEEGRTQAQDDMRDCDYQLHVEAGPAERTTTDFTKGATLLQARTLVEKLLDAGVFSWEESYPDDPQAGMARWMLGVVFDPGVFEIRSRGGSAYPQGYDAMMEAFYELGLPRPGQDESVREIGFSGVPFGEAAVSGKPFNMQSMQGFLKAVEGMDEGLDGFNMAADMQRIMADMQADPQRMHEMLRNEFRSMPADQQDAMIDMLASMGFASRAWWERFFRGL